MADVIARARDVKIATPVTHLYPSPLRYPGGKGKLANFIKLVMLENGLVGSEYVETYAGGAAVALSLLFEEYATHIHINDLNRSVYAFWNAVLNETDKLCDRIERARVSIPEWRRQRRVQTNEEADPLDLAFSTFFLNRTSRSGILNGGIIGGHSQTGEWKIDARWKSRDLIRRIQRIARFKTRITLTKLDAADYLRERLPDVGRPFLYLDPPYYVKGSKLYEHFYGHDDHVEIASLVQGLDVPWIVSYDAAPPIVEIYAAYQQISYDLIYSAGARQHGREVMFFSDRLRIPETDSPSMIHPSVVAATRLGRRRPRSRARS